MKIHALWIIAIALGLAACGKQEPPAPEQADTSGTTPSTVTEPEETVAPPAPAFDEEFLNHMHAHAEHMDDLMFALADGDLLKARTPAYWLSRHRSVMGVPDEWQQYVEGMRDAAFAVEAAPDLESARVAAERIGSQTRFPSLELQKGAARASNSAGLIAAISAGLVRPQPTRICASRVRNSGTSQTSRA